MRTDFNGVYFLKQLQENAKMWITTTINQFVVSKEKHFLSYQNEFLHSKPEIKVCDLLICCLQDYLELPLKNMILGLLFTNMKD